MYKVNLFCCFKDDYEIQSIFSRVLELPFVPLLGMSFEKSMHSIWENNPSIIEKIYWEIDDEMFIVRLSDVTEKLTSTFWEEVPNYNINRFRYFEQYL